MAANTSLMLDAQHLQPLAVEIEADLRRGHREGRAHAGRSGFWLAAMTSPRETCGQRLDACALQVEQLVLEARTGAEADDRRQVEGERRRRR